DVQSYRGYFTHEMLRRFLALAKISVPSSGVESIWRSLPKDSLNITPFIVPFRGHEEGLEKRGDLDECQDYLGRSLEGEMGGLLRRARDGGGGEFAEHEEEDFEGECGLDASRAGSRFKDGQRQRLRAGAGAEGEPAGSSSMKRLSRRMSLGVKFRRDKRADSGLFGKLEDSMENMESYLRRSGRRGSSKESVHLRILMDPTGMDPMEGVVINIDSVRRLLPKKLMTGLWPEAIKVVLNIGLHLEKPDSAIIEATSKCLEYSNKYGLIRPGDMVSILAALSKEGLSFDLLCELLNNMRIQLPVREVKRMFDLMDLNQDKSLDLQELLDGFEVLFGLFLPQLVHDHVGLSYERQGLIIMATSASLLLFCVFVGIAIKTFEGMRNELSTAVQSVLAIVGAVGLQTGASQDSKEIEERMKERIEDIMGGDIETSMSQIELGEDSQYPLGSENVLVLREKRSSSRVITRSKNSTGGGSGGTPSGLMIVTEKGPILRIGYSLPGKFRSDINDPRPCITFYSQDNVSLEPVFYCTKGVVNQQHNIFVEDGVTRRWCIKPALPKYTGLTFSVETGTIFGTIPTHSQSKIGYVRRVSTLESDGRSSSV
ncbi:transmembrane domain-containing protein, partial [Cryptosporidium canis]